MKFAFLQLYSEPGVSFERLDGPLLQALGNSLTHLNQSIDALSQKLGGDDFKLLLTLSSKSGIDEVEIKGPTLWPKKKTAGYSLFIPWQAATNFQEEVEHVLPYIGRGVREIYKRYGVSVGGIDEVIQTVLEEVRAAPEEFQYRH
jgi:hypothetical protein